MSNGRHLSVGSSPPPLVKGKLRLYSMRFCPFAQRVHLVLSAKKIPHDIVYINLTDKPEWLTQKSPLGKVPALELENGVVMYESLILAEYLDSYPGRQLSNPDPLQRALDKILVEHFNTVIGAYYKVYTDFKNFNSQDVLRALDTFEEELAKRGTAFFGGLKAALPSPGITQKFLSIVKPVNDLLLSGVKVYSYPGISAGMPDYMIWPWCERADMLSVLAGDSSILLQKERFPKLMEWKRFMLEDDAVKEHFLEPQIHANFFKSRELGNGKPNYDMLVAA